ncbi:hypothetical protein GCM10011380_36090 [Sphingomonas metalli]|uniref:Lipoprotein n=1 Tax=Sphingomonas metalli TaxID=1779358 RepID=A0A916TGU4_9SPHN|nr:hypothetical protein [Sphingomonas metalli]GGB43423.1 hypothetical protein GCM10011380_36090 [Sphingomonas metalli]
MKIRHFRSITLPLAGAVLLGGCATYGGSPPPIVYLPAPCDTPGALRVVPVTSLPGPALANPAAELPIVPSPPVAGTADGSRPLSGERCLVASAARQGGYYGQSYPYRYGYPGYYGAPFYGSLGFGFGLAGHHLSSGHLGGGHLGISHGGGHHGGGHH